MSKLKQDKPVAINAENFTSADEWTLYECLIEIQDSLKKRMKESLENDNNMQQHLEVVARASNDLLTQTTVITTN